MNVTLLGVGIGMGLAAFGGAIGIGIVIQAAIQSMARQPEQQNAIRTYMFLGIAFVEAVVLYELVVCFIIMGK